jgi:hypothetical protein
MPAGAYGETKWSLRREMASHVVVTDAINTILAAPPPPIASVQASPLPPGAIPAMLGILQLPGVLFHQDCMLP